MLQKKMKEHFMTRAVLSFVIVHISATQIVHSGGMFGQLHSTNYPNTYPDNSDQSWNITVPHGLTVELIFQNFDLEYSNECEYDYVKVSSNGQDLVTLCGGNSIGTLTTPGDVIYTSFDNQMTVQFHSDFSNKLHYYGFLAHYYARDINECKEQNGGCDHYCRNYIGGFDCSCRRGFQLHSDLSSCKMACSENMLYSREGIISSPEYPLLYPRQLQCDWTINVNSGYVIKLNFVDFDIKGDPDVDCQYDSLQIESDGNTDGPFCGSEQPPNITTMGHVVKISLLSDGLRSGRGFKAVYTTTAKPCVEITAPEYGSLIGDDFTYLATVIFRCNDGYVLKGSEARSCRADGSWSGEPTQCQIVDCNRPPSIPHGSWRSDSNNFTYTNYVLYECDRFYNLSLESESIRTCSTDGVWIPEELPVCEQICGNAVVAPHRRPVGKITGGRTVVPGSWPWQALIRIQRKPYQETKQTCGGVLINDQWVLTAAHCFNDTRAKYGRAILPTTAIQIYLGLDDMNSRELLEVYPEKIIAHPKFDKVVPFNADIALVKLNQAVQFSSVILPICLPEQSNSTNNRKANIEHYDKPSRYGVTIGWGKLSAYHGRDTNFLREVYVPLTSRKTCRDAYRALEFQVTANMLCAGEREGGRDACEGDSGGPYMFRNDDLAYFVHGIVSWGNGCGLPGYYGVYTRVENFVDWIRNTTATG